MFDRAGHSIRVAGNDNSLLRIDHPNQFYATFQASLHFILHIGSFITRRHNFNGQILLNLFNKPTLPLTNEVGAALTHTISLTYSEAISAATVNTGTIVAQGTTGIAFKKNILDP